MTACSRALAQTVGSQLYIRSTDATRWFRQPFPCLWYDGQAVFSQPPITQIKSIKKSVVFHDILAYNLEDVAVSV